MNLTQILRVIQLFSKPWASSPLSPNLGDMDNAERLCKLDLFLVQRRHLRSDLIQYRKVMKGHCSIPADSMFAQPQNAPTKGHKLKVFVSCSITDVCKHSFARRPLVVAAELPPSLAQKNNEHLYYLLFLPPEIKLNIR